ncbi:hypothetical protein BKE38_14515 [Pseudoroseomonas deserti]|uniref:Uncharacterized protein n=1 Tax=Teichococcus deserti TaxID=1817963 RepID=A0A1V2H3C6_9PROT|nr:hypothetical protein [Pseudoroseomonas deserti]ONG52452.1 hypothetical protein BKE38_14515 [Pseudoroseomonas deserti]
MRLSPPAPFAAPSSVTAQAGRRLLPALLLLPLLAGCASSASGGAEAGAPASLGLPTGSTVDAIRGTPGLGDPLRPEPGNIWADGLTPSANAPGPMGMPGK